MNKSIVILALVLLVGLPALAAFAERGQHRDYRRGGPPFAKALFPPEMVMRHSQALGLSDEQREAIIATIQQTQSEIVPLEWEVRERTQVLSGILEQTPVDEGAAMKQVEQVTEVETKMKKTHLSLLIRVKNLLTPEQVEQLAELRPHRRRRGSERQLPAE